MIKISLTLLSFALFLGCKTSEVTEKQKILNLELNRNKLIAANDTVTLDKIYADDFTGISSNGTTINKTKLMGFFKTANNAPPSDYIFSSIDHVVQLLSHRTALLTGKIVVKNKQDKILQQTIFVDVIIKKNGRWQIVYGQETVIQ